jgi:uncharacterized protein (DUF2062 family)
MRHTLRDSLVHRLFGERIFHPHIWGFDINSLAGGLSAGLFIAFTPTIPFHMVLSTIATLLLRVNLPIALAACWVTNPVTALPVYVAAYKLGQHLLRDTWLASLTLNIFGFETRTGHFMENSLYLWSGSLIFAITAAVAGNIAIRAVWFLNRWLKDRVIRHDDRII